MTPCVLFDIDGTLADHRHRLHHVTGGRKDWDAFFGAMHLDVAHEAITDLARTIMRARCDIILVSGRPDNHRQVTEEWLFYAGVPVSPLYMRKAGDHRADHIVKREILARIRADGFEPWLVIDDRPQVVEMWRAEGLTCLQMPYEDGGPSPELAGRELLTVMVGPSGAGKSRYVDARYPSRWIIASDDIRADLLGDRYDQSDPARVFKVVHALARERLKHGLPTVIDATNIKRKDRMACANLVPPGVRVVYVVVDRPLDEKLETRDWRPVELIVKHHQTFQSQLKDILAGDGLDHVRVEDCRS